MSVWRDVSPLEPSSCETGMSSFTGVKLVDMELYPQSGRVRLATPRYFLCDRLTTDFHLGDASSLLVLSTVRAGDFRSATVEVISSRSTIQVEIKSQIEHRDMIWFP